MNLLEIKDPSQIKSLSEDQLKDLAADIRSFLLSSISKTGGHLSSNLGIVELTLAMHYVFDSPKDKFIFDVGHQAYTHKILTGRADRFQTLRQKDGLSGFQKRAESEHDPWEAGHSSTSLSAAIGMAAARDLRHEQYEIIPVIGDGALTGGMALEALNDLGAQNRKVIIIFNDNKMSISRNSGGMEQAITRIRASDLYRNTKKGLNTSLPHSLIGKGMLNVLHNGRTYLKHQMIDAPLFSQFNLDYIGPVDGHNIHDLIHVLQAAKDHDGPIVVHVVTKKGKGYAPAEKDQNGAWHGVSPFDLKTGKPLHLSSPKELSWSEVISKTLIRLAKEDPLITAITPAMATGSKLLEFHQRFPERFFDCGIAEQHAITMAGGMAAGGLKPFVSVYSSFLQRAYDQISHDVARMNLPVVVGIDRSGLVGEDGATHQGIYDIAFLRSIPNVILCQPKDAQEAQDLLYSGFQSGKPWFIRYPRGSAPFHEKAQLNVIETGTWTSTSIGTPEQIVITYGPEVDRVIRKARENHLNLQVVNARFFKPIDKAMMQQLLDSGLPITVYETDTTCGGLSEAILEEMNRQKQTIHILGIDDKFVPHGSVRSLRKMEHIAMQDLMDQLDANALMQRQNQASQTERSDSVQSESCEVSGQSSCSVHAAADQSIAQSQEEADCPEIPQSPASRISSRHKTEKPGRSGKESPLQNVLSAAKALSGKGKKDA